jgi:hypothetical protein
MDPSRPRLYFTADEVARLRERARTTGLTTWEEIRSWCEMHLTDEPPPILPGDGYDAKGLYLEANFLNRISLFSFAHLIGQDERYLGPAKSWLLALARMPEWAGPCGNRPDAGLYAGLGEIALGVGYDWLYQELAPAERAEVRGKMTAVAQTLHEATREGEWWTGAYWHHDLIIPVAGLGVGALALHGETPEAAEWLSHAVAQTAAVFDRIGDDGAWHEGAAPWSFGTMALLLFLDPLERVAGESFWERPWLQETAHYRLHCWLPPDRVVNFDDCHSSSGYSTLTRDCAAILYRLAGQYSNPQAQWLGDIESAAKRNPDSLCWRFLWRDPGLEPESPEGLPLSRLFANQGILVSRAGWAADDPVLAFTSAPPIGHRGVSFAVNADGSPNLGANVGSYHTHADQLSLMVYANGDYLISPPGYGRRDAQHQNCILVDGRGPRRYADSDEPLADGGRVSHVMLTPGLDVVIGEAAACYPPELGVQQVTRRLLYARPGTIMLSDDVLLERPHAIEWRFHAGPGVGIERDGSGLLFVGRRAALCLLMLSPQDVQVAIETDRRHQWVALRWPVAASAAHLRVVMQIMDARPQ